MQRKGKAEDAKRKPKAMKSLTRNKDFYTKRY